MSAASLASDPRCSPLNILGSCVGHAAVQWLRHALAVRPDSQWLILHVRGKPCAMSFATREAMGRSHRLSAATRFASACFPSRCPTCQVACKAACYVAQAIRYDTASCIMMQRPPLHCTRCSRDALVPEPESAAGRKMVDQKTGGGKQSLGPPPLQGAGLAVGLSNRYGGPPL